MEVYYVELQKATVLEKKFIYSTFGMELLSAAVQMLTPTPALTPTAHIASLVHFSLSPPAPGPDGLRRGPRV